MDANQSRDRRIVMASDPSLTAWGWATMCGETDIVLDAGVISTKPESKARRIRKSDDRQRRIRFLAQSILSIIESNNVNILVSELPHGAQNAQGMAMVGIVGGILETIAVCQDLPLEWYTQWDARSAIDLPIKSSKLNIINRIRELYGEGGWFTGVKKYDEAVADALAVYTAARKNSPLLQGFRR